MPEILIILILCAGIIVIGIILCIIIKVSHMSDSATGGRRGIHIIRAGAVYPHPAGNQWN